MDLIDEPEEPLRASINEDSIRELAFSMKELGQLQPIGVRPKGNGRYEIIYGHRRFLAAQWLGWKHIKAEVLSESESQSHAARLVENTQRENLSPIEEAYALRQLQERLGETSIRELCQVTGKSPGWVRQRLEMLNWPEDVQAAVHIGAISIGVAEQIARISSDDTRRHYLQAAIESGCSTTMAEIWVNAALLAEQGIAEAKRLEDVQREVESQAPGMQQLYTCFICRHQKNWRQVNLLVICGHCQEEIANRAREAIWEHEGKERSSRG